MITALVMFTMIISFVYGIIIKQSSVRRFFVPTFFNNPLYTSLFKNSFAESNGNRDMVQLMARAINGEARGEPYEGQVAVGAVILNRVQNSKFPKTIPGVIYQPGAFTAVSDGQINLGISTNSAVYKAARDSMNGWDPTSGCIYYYNPATATNKWIWSRPVVVTIGKHKFAK